MGFFTRKRRKRWREPSESASEADMRSNPEQDNPPAEPTPVPEERTMRSYTREEIIVRSAEGLQKSGVQGILDSLVANICVVDGDGTIVAVNQAWKRFAEENDYRTDEAGFIGTDYGIGRNYFTVCTETAGDDTVIAHAAARGLKEILNGERERFVLEYPCHSPNAHRWFLLTITPIASPMEGAIVSHFNITEQTELRQANQSLDAFTQSLALAFRTPLRFMRTHLDALLAPDSVSTELQTELHQLTKNVDQLDSMVRDLLAYGRIGRSNILLRPVDLDQAVKEALSYHTAEIRQKKARISIAKSFPYVLADPVLLAETLSCIISNSLKFVHPGTEPELVIHAENRPDAVWVWVEDCGIGIEAKDYSSIFMIFKRGEGAAPYQGNGIGLAIVERSMTQMKGFVEVTQREGGGTRFKLIFPKQTPRRR